MAPENNQTYAEKIQETCNYLPKDSGIGLCLKILAERADAIKTAKAEKKQY